MTPPPSSTTPITPGQVAWGIAAFVGGFVIAIVIDFVLTFFTVPGDLIGPPKPAGTELILASWLVSGGTLWVLYKVHRWAAYGMLGGFAALFLVLALGGGLLGPYACFNAYGYPAPR